MTQSRIDSITYTARRGSPPRTPRAGDEKMIRGVLHVRQQERHGRAYVVSNGRPVWEWVEWGSERDYCSEKARYRTLRGGGVPHGLLVPEPPEGWKILEAGRPVPKEHLVFIHEYGLEPNNGWRPGPGFKSSFEACAASENRAYAIPKTPAEMTRDYFEDGCLCIGQLFKKRGPEIGAERAVKFYMSRCKCSRHPQGTQQ